MIGYIVLTAVAILPAAFVWLHMHHKNALREVEDRVMSDISDIWRDARELEAKLTHKIENSFGIEDA